MIRRIWVSAFTALALVGAAASDGVGAPRLTIKNQCTDDVWTVLTPGGSPTQVAALDNSGGWFHRNYAQQERFILLAGSAKEGNLTGSITKGSQTLTLSSHPDDSAKFFFAGQIVKVVGAGPSGTDLVTPISGVVIKTRC